MRNGGYVRQAWLVLMLAVCFGAALAVVHVVLKDRIAENVRNEVYCQIPYLVPGADQNRTEELTVTAGPEGKEKNYRVYKVVAAGEGGHLGWVVRASGQGFADKIEVLIGLDVPAETLTGLYVLDQKETPGLGNKIGPNFPWDDQFPGKQATEPLTVTKSAPTGNQIRAVTGATVSSESVCEIVNKALSDVAATLAAKAKEKD